MSNRWRPLLVFEPALDDKGVPEEEGLMRARRPPGQSWRDHLVMLLDIAAEIEHGLMIQYLYAAYSLGGPEADTPERRALVGKWRSGILRVAMEEMGHLLTVQNILCLLGAPINLERSDYPYDIPYYPFPFALEPLTRGSLACYIHAEMPPGILAMLENRDPLPKRLRQFRDKDKAEIERLVQARTRHDPPQVQMIYDEIVDLIADEDRIPDEAFDEDSYSMQAGWDDWGRRHGPAPELLDVGGSVVRTPPHQRQANVLVLRAATRTQAIAALKAIGSQGEAPHLDPKDGEEPSHFERFLHIFQDFPDDWTPTLNVPMNPSTRHSRSAAHGYLAAKAARDWGALFNLRYRMLLTYVALSFRLARRERPGAPGLRSMAMHRVFGEMYNLKTLAAILTRQPLAPHEDPAHPRVAGPPFETPHSLHLPDGAADAWRLPQQLHVGSIEIGEALLPHARGADADYLRATMELDRGATAWIDSILAGLRAAGRAQA